MWKTWIWSCRRVCVLVEKCWFRLTTKKNEYQKLSSWILFYNKTFAIERNLESVEERAYRWLCESNIIYLAIVISELKVNLTVEVFRYTDGWFIYGFDFFVVQIFAQSKWLFFSYYCSYVVGNQSIIHNIHKVYNVQTKNEWSKILR